MAEIDTNTIETFAGVAWAVAYRSEDNTVKRFSPCFTTLEELEWAHGQIQSLDPMAELSVIEHYGNLH